MFISTNLYVILMFFKKCLPYETYRLFERRFTVAQPYTDCEVMSLINVQLIANTLVDKENVSEF